MNGNAGFVLVLAGLDTALLAWGLRVLPRERMQVIATLPWRKRQDGLWTGINLTWYGVLQSLAMVSSVALALVLAGAARVPAASFALAVACLLATALPAAGLVARLVERRPGTFTVGGAVCVATLLLPWIALGVDAALAGDHALPLVSAVAVAYPFGEGIGRLACISFGCCFGRKLSDCGPRLRTWLGWWTTVVVGPTRKAAYAGECAGQRLLPAPALSAVVLSVAGVASLPLYLAGHFRGAAALALGVAFSWRFFSEFLRADYRGEGRWSAYQWMALFCLAYVAVVLACFPLASPRVDIAHGLFRLTSPLVLAGLAVLGGVVFLYLGVSKTTFAIIRLEVRESPCLSSAKRRDQGMQAGSA